MNTYLLSLYFKNEDLLLKNRIPYIVEEFSLLVRDVAIILEIIKHNANFLNCSRI